MLSNNLVLLLNSVMNTLGDWSKFKLSWFSRIDAIKMKIRLKFLFVFQNMIAVVPQTLLQEILVVINLSGVGIELELKLQFYKFLLRILDWLCITLDYITMWI